MVIIDLVTTLVVVGALGVLLIGLLAPMESLGWWAGWSGESHLPLPEAGVAQPKRVLVYLSGIGSISGDELLAEEALFLDHPTAAARRRDRPRCLSVFGQGRGTHERAGVCPFVATARSHAAAR